MRALAGITLGVAIAIASACASTGVRPQPFPTPPHQPDSPPTPAPLGVPGAWQLGDGFNIASAALRLQGLPYRLGGADPRGFDCSGFVQYVFGLYGFALPRVVHEQYRVGHTVSLDDLVPGDLVFFVTQGDEVSHVGIVIGGDRFVHAPNSRGVVRIDSLASSYWGDRVAGARRMEIGN